MNDSADDHPHVFPEGRKPGEILFAGLMVLSGGLLLAAIGWQTAWLPGRGLAAQPRFWPALSLGGIVLFGLLNFAARSGVQRTPGRWREALSWVLAVEYIGWYVVYVWAIPVIGYLLATLLFCVLLCLRAGYRGRALVIAALFGLAVVLMFKTGFNVRIPAGAIYAYAPDSIRYILYRYF